jgi:protein-S-isoprenylcysteine O-methyltransferase Ste14
MVKIGNFFFRYRNALFPLAYILLFCKSPPVLGSYRVAVSVGFMIALVGQVLRALTIGLDYIVRGGRGRQVYASRLVQGGIFAHCRNPLYIGNFLILLGVGVASNSVLFLGAAMPFFAFAYWAIIAAEENFLRSKFGSEFDRYCARVNRFMPQFSGLGQTLAGSCFNWRRLISAEYGATYIWLAAIFLLTLKHAWLNGEYQANQAIVWGSWSLLVCVTLAYGAARFLKKKGYLKTSGPTAS